MRVVIYLRVSDDKQVKGYSIPEQREVCRNYAAAHGYTVVAEFAEDYTGTEYDRPELDKIRELAKDRQFDIMLLIHPDRLARKLVKQTIIRYEFSKHGVSLEYAKVKFADTPEGHLHENLYGMMAEYERERILERTGDGRRRRAKEGSVNPGKCSKFGFRYVKTGDKTGSYAVVDGEADIVRLVFDWYTTGDENGKPLGREAIAHKLSDLGIPTRLDSVDTSKWKKRGQKRLAPCVWRATQIADIINDPIYKGVYIWNKTRRENGKQIPRPESEWIYGTVPAIISPELWQLAQERKAENRKRCRRNTKGEYLMQGRLRCAVCGCSVQIVPAQKKGRAYPHYRCGGTLRSKREQVGPNHAYGVAVHKIDTAVWNLAEDLIRHPEKIAATADKHRRSREKRITTLNTRIEVANKKLAELETDEATLLREQLRGRYTRAVIDTELDRISAERKQLAEEIAQFESEKAEMPESRIDVSGVRAYCAEILLALDNLTFEGKRGVLDKLNITAAVDWLGEGRANVYLSTIVPNIPGVANGGLESPLLSRKGLNTLWHFTLEIAA